MSQRVLQWQATSQKWGRLTKVSPALILAIIDQESGGNHIATRYEALYEKNYFTKCANIASIAKIKTSQVATSYGLMQLMMPLAWGYLSESDKVDPIKALFNPDNNIRYGSAHLSTLIRKRTLTDMVILSVAGRYNGGGETSRYAKNILALYYKYKEALN